MSSKSQAKSKKNQTPQDNPQPAHGQDWWSKFQPFLFRYGWDVLAVFFLMLALLTLFGLLEWTTGSLISGWKNFIRHWLGWGSYSIVFVLSAVAFWIFRRRVLGRKGFSLYRVLLLEIGFFALIIYLAIHGGVVLQRADAGLDGGVIGWGLASLLLRVFPQPVVAFLSISAVIFFWAAGFGLFHSVIRWLDQWSRDFILRASGEQISEPLLTVSEPLQVSAIKEKAARPLKTTRMQPQAVMTPAIVIHRDQALPPFDILAKEQVVVMDESQVIQMGTQIEQTLEEFGIPAKVAGYRVGPTVTQFALEPGFVEREGPDGVSSKHKVRVSQISSLARDLALALSAERLRIEAPVPGQSYVGIEVPNPESKLVRLRPILESESFQRLNSPLALALGQDVSGQAVVADLIRMPHILIAGTTGSGKSVCVSAVTACLLMNNSPRELRIAMLDPKMVELVRFNGVPHLLGKVETSIDRMIGVLHWAIAEMDQRYRLLEEAKARDLEAYNLKMTRKNQATLPRIVVLVDELADLMMSAPDQTEHGLVRLAQMARAVGIHLIVATQRPSTDVVTGLIKANFPARIAFTVASSIDSRVILDMNGAETLMGKGDMLFLAPDVGAPQRSQGVMVSDPEIDAIIQFWQNAEADQPKEAAPWEDMMKVMQEDGGDDLVKQAIELVKTSRRASASLLQRRLRIGFPRAARLLDQLEEMGVVGPSQGGGRDREVLIDSSDNWEDMDTPGNYDDTDEE
jgi:S-DNA-T family DNA segregation ATPase FtsK/SpoIIIE